MAKPMRGAPLTQAIARVNRTFKGKPSGLVVDYLGIAEDLQSAPGDYTRRDRRSRELGQDLREQAIPAIPAVIEKHRVVCTILAGCHWRDRLADPPVEHEGRPRRPRDVPVRAPRMWHSNDDAELGEYAVGVNWLATRYLDQAVRFDAMFSNQTIVCRLRREHDIEALERAFGVPTGRAAPPESTP